MSTGGMPAAAPEDTLGASLLPQIGQPGGWRAWVSRPENRAALVQAGIELLQPIGVGESVGGRVGTALGSGLEARDRVVTGQQEQEQQALQNQIAQQEADARSLAAQASMVNAASGAAGGGLTAYQQIQLERGRMREFRQFVAAKERNLFPGDTLPDVETLAQEFLQLNVTAPNLPGGGAPAAAPASLATATGAAAPAAPPGAVTADDGIPTVSTPEEAAKLPSGTQFRDPTGKLRVVP